MVDASHAKGLSISSISQSAANAPLLNLPPDARIVCMHGKYRIPSPNPRTYLPLHPIDLPYNILSRRKSSSQPPTPLPLAELYYSKDKCSSASTGPKRLSLPNIPKFRQPGLLLCLTIIQTPRQLPTRTRPGNVATTFSRLLMAGHLQGFETTPPEIADTPTFLVKTNGAHYITKVFEHYP